MSQRFLTPFSPPEESEFYERGFILAPGHDPDEAVMSYRRQYPDGFELSLTFLIGSTTTLRVVINRQDTVVSEAALESVKELSFQSWHGDRILRFHFTLPLVDMDLRVHYEPLPAMYLTSLPMEENKS